MISAKDLFFGSAFGPLSTGDGRFIDGRTGTERLALAGEEAEIGFDGVSRLLMADEAGGLSEGRVADDPDFVIEVEDVIEGLSDTRDTGFDTSPPWREGPFWIKPARGDFDTVEPSSSSALRFGADDTVLVTVEEGGSGFSPLIDASRSPI